MSARTLLSPRLMIPALVLGSLGSNPPALAEAPVPTVLPAPPMANPIVVPKLAVIDMEQLMKRSQRGARMLADLAKLLEDKQAEAREIEAELKQIRTQAVEKAGKASNAELESLQRRYNSRLEDLRQFQNEANQELEKKRVETLSAFNHLAMPLIQRQGREQGYALIFRKQEGGLLFADTSVDITDQLVQTLDAQNP